MLICSSLILLISNALTKKRALSILFSRSLMILLLVITLLILDNFTITLLTKGLAIYSGVFFVKPYVQSYAFFICFITALILTLTSYYPRKLLNNDDNSFIKGLISRPNTNLKNKSEIIKKIFIDNENLEQFKIIEYPLLILFVLNGALLLMSCNDLVSIFLCIELQSYGLYLLCALYRNSELSIEAALTYFLLGGLSSCIILLGQSLLYINSGNTNLDGIYIISNISETINYSLLVNNLDFMNIYQYYIEISLVVLSVGFLFKISAAPFHSWSPDVYDKIPTIVTTFVAIVAKISILIMFFELVYYTSSNLFAANPISWKNSLVLSSLLSMIIGSLLGLTQSRIKRLYAYSTISHLGFILLALSVISVESSSAFFFYLIQYSITNLNAFLIIIAIGYTLYSSLTDKNSNDGANQQNIMARNITEDSYETDPKNIMNRITIENAYESYQKNTVNGNNLADIRNRVNDHDTYQESLVNDINKANSRDKPNKDEENRNYSPLQYTKEMANYYKTNTALALSLAITLFSFLGVPPLLGFFGKQMVLSASLDRGYIFMVLVAILTSVISAVYYLIIIKVLFFENTITADDSLAKLGNKSEALKVNSNHWFVFFDAKKIVLTSFLTNVISLITLILTLFMFISKENISFFLLLSLYQAKQ